MQRIPTNFQAQPMLPRLSRPERPTEQKSQVLNIQAKVNKAACLPVIRQPRFGILQHIMALLPPRLTGIPNPEHCQEVQKWTAITLSPSQPISPESLGFLRRKMAFKIESGEEEHQNIRHSPWHQLKQGWNWLISLFKKQEPSPLRVKFESPPNGQIGNKVLAQELIGNAFLRKMTITPSEPSNSEITGDYYIFNFVRDTHPAILLVKQDGTPRLVMINDLRPSFRDPRMELFTFDATGKLQKSILCPPERSQPFKEMCNNLEAIWNTLSYTPKPQFPFQH